MCVKFPYNSQKNTNEAWRQGSKRHLCPTWKVCTSSDGTNQHTCPELLGKKNTQLSKPRSVSKTRSWPRARAGWGPQSDTNRLQRSGGIKSHRFPSFIYQRGRHDRHRSNMSWSSHFQFLAKRDLFEKHTSRKSYSNESYQWNYYFSTNVIL